MTRRLLSLGGLAILVVVLHHAAGFGQVALFLWADRYRAVNVPDWGALGSWPHYVLIVVKSIGIFAVPAFLFISGFFSAYLSRGSTATRNPWKPIFIKVSGLVIPYAFWSVLIFVGDAFQGTTYKLPDYLVKLLTSGASAHLYFVPLLCACYILSPWIVASVRKRPKLLLSFSASLLVAALIVHYLRRFGISGVILGRMSALTPGWSLPWWIFYFILGSLIALNVKKTKELLTRYRWHLAGLLVVSWLLSILETDFWLQKYRSDWVAGVDTLSYHVFSLSALMSFLAFEKVELPRVRIFNELSKRSYGVYLVHPLIIESMARIIRRFAPWLLAYQWVLVPLLFAAGLGIPLLAMTAVKKWSPESRVYRYLFG